jgi:DMSO/TMAO reductase YedYZ molybdopterin-dependent catalytic subunit
MAMIEALGSMDTPKEHLYQEDSERASSLSPPGTHPYIRNPPPPHDLNKAITPNDQLFQTIHFAPAPTIDLDAYRLVVDANDLDDPNYQPRIFTLSELKDLPSTEVTSFHECYGPPTLRPDTNRWRVGCVKWTGVRLSTLLHLAGISFHLGVDIDTDRDPWYVHADGLDKGRFAGHKADRYRKDVPLNKALDDDVIVAYAMNGELLSEMGKERGGPVRLVVPGWFGTVSVKWLCKLAVREGRAEGMFSRGRFYNEVVSRQELLMGVREEERWRLGWWEKDAEGEERSGVWMKPVWKVDVNSLMFQPKPDERFPCQEGRNEAVVEVVGWAWSDPGVERVEVSLNQGETWLTAHIHERKEREWQQFKTPLDVGKGQWTVIARAKCKSGQVQPLEGRRNHVHSVKFWVA